MRTHRYKVGQKVTFEAPRNRIGGPGIIYQIVRLIPVERDGTHYRIKSTSEAFERIVKETEISLHVTT